MVKLQLETLSPVYIGNTGTEYSRSEFAFAKFSGETKLVRLNLDLCAQELYNTDKKFFNEFLDVLSDNNSFKNIKNKKHNNQYIQKNRVDLKGMHKFLNKRIKEYDKSLFNKIMIKFSSYNACLKYGVKFTEIREGKKYRIKRKNEDIDDIGLIKENLKTNNKPYISGSSIKGAVRNTLLYSILNLNGIKNNKVFKVINDKDKQIKNLMNFIQFSDTLNTIDEPTIYGIESIGTKNTFAFIETIDKGNHFEFEYRNTFNDSVHNSRRLLDLDLSVDSIFKYIYNFSNDILEEELRFIDETIEYDKLYSEVDSEKLYDHYNNLKDKNSEESPLLRLGQGSGALGVSQLLKVKNSRNRYEFTSFRKSNYLGHKYDYDFPKTRKLIVNSLEPLGWVQLSK